MRGSEGMSGRTASVTPTHALHSLQHRHAGATSVPTRPRQRSGWWTPPRQHLLSCAAEAGEGDATNSSQEPESSVPDSLPVSGADTDWREFRARLIRSQTASTSGREAEEAADTSKLYWAHPIANPEKGCVLIAHPLMFTTQQQYFAQSVIFIFEHSESGSAGLILNKPTEHTIGSIDGLESLCPEFADNCLFMGGDVSPNSMHMLHSHGELPNSVEIIQGLSMGGFDEAKAAIRDGRMPAQDFKWCTRYAGWGVGQLASECASGVWFTAAASAAFILQQDPGAGRTDTGRQMWHQVLELMGGEHAGLSQEAKGLYNPQIMGSASPETPEGGEEA